MRRKEIQGVLFFLYVIAVLVALLLLGCGNDLDEALAEVKRLEELKAKTAEIAEEQKANVQKETAAYSQQIKNIRDSQTNNALKMHILMKEIASTEYEAELQGVKIDTSVIDSLQAELDKATKRQADMFGLLERVMRKGESKLDRMRDDLTRSEAVYDSISALHTQAVFRLSSLQK